MAQEPTGHFCCIEPSGGDKWIAREVPADGVPGVQVDLHEVGVVRSFQEFVSISDDPLAASHDGCVKIQLSERTRTVTCQPPANPLPKNPKPPKQPFGLKNLGSEPVFFDFAMSNPATRSQYRMAIRGASLGQNFCTCPDFATNDLGTCKHIEFTLDKLHARRGGNAQWALCPDGYTGLQALLQAAQEFGHELRCHDDVWQFVASQRDARQRESVLAKAYQRAFAAARPSRLAKTCLGFRALAAFTFFS